MLVWDKKFKPWVDKYAKDSDAFFADFSSAFSRLLELGERTVSLGSRLRAIGQPAWCTWGACFNRRHAVALERDVPAAGLWSSQASL